MQVYKKSTISGEEAILLLNDKLYKLGFFNARLKHGLSRTYDTINFMFAVLFQIGSNGIYFSIYSIVTNISKIIKLLKLSKMKL